MALPAGFSRAVIQPPRLALRRPLRLCAAGRRLPGVCKFEYSSRPNNGHQAFSRWALRSVRGALNGRIVPRAERSRHDVSNSSSFQTTASCFRLLEQEPGRETILSERC